MEDTKTHCDQQYSSRLHEATLYNSKASAPLPDEFHIVQAHVICRHGDRSPLNNPAAGGPKITEDHEHKIWSEKMPSFEFLSKLNRKWPIDRRTGNNLFHFTKWKRPFGHLTTRGVRQAKQIGRQLLSTYGHLLDDEDDKMNDNTRYKNAMERVRVFSTETQRTIHTAQCLLDGMMTTDSLDTSAREGFLKVEIRDSDCEVIGSSSLHKSDPALRKRLDAFEETIKVREENENLRKIRQRITIGVDAFRTSNIPFRWFNAADWAVTRIAHNLPLLNPYRPLPVPAKSIENILNASDIGDECMRHVSWAQCLRYKQYGVARLCTAPLLYEIARNMTAKWKWPSAESPKERSHSPVVSSSKPFSMEKMNLKKIPSRFLRNLPPKRLNIYVGHDSTIIPLLAIFVGEGNELENLLEEFGGWPPYMSTICLELIERRTKIDDSETQSDGMDKEVSSLHLQDQVSEPKLFVRVVFNGKPLDLQLDSEDYIEEEVKGCDTSSGEESVESVVDKNQFVTKVKFDKFIARIIRDTEEDVRAREEYKRKEKEEEEVFCNNSDFERPKSAEKDPKPVSSMRKSKSTTSLPQLHKTASWRATKKGNRSAMWSPAPDPRSSRIYSAKVNIKNHRKKIALPAMQNLMDRPTGKVNDSSALKILRQQLLNKAVK
eukprot:g3061.t1